MRANNGGSWSAPPTLSGSPGSSIMSGILLSLHFARLSRLQPFLDNMVELRCPGPVFSFCRHEKLHPIVSLQVGFNPVVDLSHAHLMAHKNTPRKTYFGVDVGVYQG